MQSGSHPNSIVKVAAPARLHLGFLDLNGSLGRKFGSIGLAINSHQTHIEIKSSSSTVINSIEQHQKIKEIVDLFYTTLGQDVATEQRHIELTVKELIPEHAGFGSGTQLALTIGTALCQFHQVSAQTGEIANQLGRGSRSGIGIATFDHGGFIIDGGQSNKSTIPPLLVHSLFPENWRIVLIMDNEHQGVHGSEELSAFKELETFPLANSQAICHLTLMKLLPALTEQDLPSFGQAVTDIQTLIGDHFAPAQGGRYSSDSVAQILNHALKLGYNGIAQSSWGPTGCVFVESDEVAKTLCSELKQFSQLTNMQNLSFIVATADLSGANIEIISA